MERLYSANLVATMYREPADQNPKDKGGAGPAAKGKAKARPKVCFKWLKGQCTEVKDDFYCNGGGAHAVSKEAEGFFAQRDWIKVNKELQGRAGKTDAAYVKEVERLTDRREKENK